MLQQVELFASQLPNENFAKLLERYVLSTAERPLRRRIDVSWNLATFSVFWHVTESKVARFWDHALVEMGSGFQALFGSRKP